MSYYRGGPCKGDIQRLYIEGDIPASAGSLCSSLLALSGKEEVLNLFSLFTAECDPGCFTLIS